MSGAETVTLFRGDAELEGRLARLAVAANRLELGLGGSLADLVADMDDAGDVPRMVRLWASLEGLRAKLAEAAELVEGIAADRLGAGVLVMPGMGRVEAKRAASRKGWDHEGLRGELVRRTRAAYRLFGWMAGRPDDLGEDAWVLQALTDAARPEWRVTPLRAVGVDVDEYCSTTWGARSLVVTPIDAAEASA